MKIRFTITLSDDTVSAFHREGAVTASGIVSVLKGALESCIDNVKNPGEAPLDEPEDEGDEDEGEDEEE